MAEPERGGPREEASVSDLPPFANAENKALDKAVRDLERDLDDTEVKLVENRDRIGIMSEHLTNVQAEIKFTQSRVESKNKEVETESHLKQLGDRETGRVTKDIEKVQAEREGLADRVTSLQNQIYKATEKMDQFKLLMNWNQEEIEQWALAQRQKEEDNAALAKYKHQDEGKTRDLRIQQEKLSHAVVSKKEEVSVEVSETQASQIQLDKAADDFRQLHAERQDLIRQWDEAMEAMKHRDSAIAVASEMFSEKKFELRSVKQQLDTQARFLEDEGLNNKEVDARIAAFDREVARQREAYMGEQQRLGEINNQVETIKSTLAKAATELAQATAQSSQAKSDLGDKRARLDAARKRYALLKRKLEGEFQQLDSMDAKVAELELMRTEEEVALRAANKLNEQLKKEQFRRSQALFELRTKERELISEISGGQGQNKNLAARISQLDEQVARQQELLYNVEFQLQQMERKVARAGGQRSEEETKVRPHACARSPAQNRPGRG
jgi:chromosome segregation ATPase